jgi:antitoxin (DNA-binding transcriptional repressor) of toxin-antitoxin stability system
MEVQVPIGKLKTHCYQILEQAQKNNNKLIITKRGNPIAEIIPTNPKVVKKSFIGTMQDKAKINSDIMEPLNISWNAENE